MPANKNMKLLSLLVTLLALSYANSDRTTDVFSEIQQRVKGLQNHKFNAHNISVDIQTPRDISNVCECKLSFAKHLKDFLRSLKSVVPRIQILNIWDSLKFFKGQPDDYCEFTRYRTKLTSENLKTFIQDYIEFISQFRAHC